MFLLQGILENIQEITGKEYDAQYSNNAESEYVQIYGDTAIEIIEDLVEVINGDNKQ